jgi:hypothetical protein
MDLWDPLNGLGAMLLHPLPVTPGLLLRLAAQDPEPFLCPGLLGGQPAGHRGQFVFDVRGPLHGADRPLPQGRRLRQHLVCPPGLFLAPPP